MPFYQMGQYDPAMDEMRKAQLEGRNRPGGQNGGEDVTGQMPYGPPPGQWKNWEEFEN